MTPDECRIQRLNLGMTPFELAAAAGIVESTVLAFEAGERSPRPTTLVALRRAFRTRLAALTAPGR